MAPWKIQLGPRPVDNMTYWAVIETEGGADVAIAEARRRFPLLRSYGVSFQAMNAAELADIDRATTHFMNNGLWPLFEGNES